MKKGFTLIELLVVIAIIGILSSVVLASLNTARSKGANASVKSNLSNMRAEGALWYDNHSSSYTGFCADPVVLSASSSISSSNGATYVGCTDTSNFSILAKLSAIENSHTYWCVDSNGYSGYSFSDAASSTVTAGAACK